MSYKEERGAPLPLGGGGLRALAPEGAKRLRCIGPKGEGVAVAVRSPRSVARLTAVSPSPFASRLALLAKRRSPPPPGGRGRLGGEDTVLTAAQNAIAD